MTTIIGVCPDCREMQNVCRCPKIKAHRLDARALERQLWDANNWLAEAKKALQFSVDRIRMLEKVAQAAEDARENCPPDVTWPEMEVLTSELAKLEKVS